MTKPKDERTPLPTHGAAVLPSVKVDSYNLEIEDEDGFVGDRANRDAFWAILDKWRKPLRELGQDPLGDRPSAEIGKKKLAALLAEGEPEAAGVVQSAIEEFAQQLALVIRRFLRLKDWRDTECLVIGGGFRGSRVGELAISRAALLLKAPRSPSIWSRSAATRMQRACSAPRICCPPGCSRATRASLPSMWGAPTSAPASSS